MNIQATRFRSLCRVLQIVPTVFIQPKTSSTHFRRRIGTTEIEHLRSDVEQGDINAQFNLAVMYANGFGVPRDYVQTYKGINLAASRTTLVAEAGDYRSARDDLAENMTASQVAEAQRLARECQPKTWEQLKDE